MVGVHSGKYHAERVTERIRDASIRLRSTHPVINDRQFRVWRSYAVNAWPTLVVVDARGYVVGQHAGEFTVEDIRPFVERMIAEMRGAGALTPRADPFVPDRPSIAPTQLCYPGKVTIDGERIAVADTGNSRVLVGRFADEGHAMHVERVIGNASVPDAIPFAAPQGVLFDGDMLYVTDSESHVLRAVSLRDGSVRTIAGIGRQARTRDDLRAGALSSPWDVTRVADRLYMAMAGSHQIWSVGRDGHDLRAHAGTRAESIDDGPLREATLAQPMGITAGIDRVYFADAESSAIREADALEDGSVRTLVGTGLFDFGDKDGVGDDVLMQHQQGLALDADGRLLVADSYNDALKWLDPATRRAETWIRGLHEPSGVALTDRHVYVADTNAHRIAIVSRATGEIRDLEIDDL